MRFVVNNNLMFYMPEMKIEKLDFGASRINPNIYDSNLISYNMFIPFSTLKLKYNVVIENNKIVNAFYGFLLILIIKKLLSKNYDS